MPTPKRPMAEAGLDTEPAHACNADRPNTITRIWLHLFYVQANKTTVLPCNK